jgi:spore coat protein CotH
MRTRFYEWLDVEQFAKCMVAYCLISLADRMETNFYLYHDMSGTGKWVFIPWDHDRTWGHQWDEEDGFFSLEIVDDTPIDYGSFSSSWSDGDWGNVLYDRYLNDPQFFAEYKSALGLALITYFAEAPTIERIDSYERLIQRAVLDDTQKWGENEDYPTRVEELRSYVPLRRAFLLDELAQ